MSLASLRLDVLLGGALHATLTACLLDVGDVLREAVGVDRLALVGGGVDVAALGRTLVVDVVGVQRRVGRIGLAVAEVLLGRLGQSVLTRAALRLGVTPLGAAPSRFLVALLAGLILGCFLVLGGHR